MQEKILQNKKHGMLVLVVSILVMLIATAATIYGAIDVETQKTALGYVALVAGLVLLCISWIPLIGLRILKPQEALVLTLFGKYIGTIKGEGFYAINPFCSSVNPAANTKLNQSGDVGTVENPLFSTKGITFENKKLSLKIMTLNNNRQKLTTVSATLSKSELRLLGEWWTPQKPCLTWTTTRNTFRSNATPRSAT